MAKYTKAELKQAVKALRSAGGVIAYAARSIGIPRTTMQFRIDAARAAGIRVEAIPQRSKADPHNVTALLRENETLKAQLERVNAARAKTWKPRKIVKRSGKDDIIRVCWPDSHGAYCDPVAMSLFLNDLKILDPDEIVMGGDHLDCGGFLAQHHVMGYVAQIQGYSYEQDVEACNSHIDLAQSNAPHARLYYLEGNHEDRVEKWCVNQTIGNVRDAEGLRRRNAPEFLLNLSSRGISYHRRGEIDPGTGIAGAIRLGKCFYVHDPGSSDPARILAMFGSSVVYFHTHTAAMLVSSTAHNGTISACNFGCLARRQMLWHHSRPSKHTHGYGVQLVARSGHFLNVPIPIIDGTSYLERLLLRGKS